MSTETPWFLEGYRAAVNRVLSGEVEPPSLSLCTVHVCDGCIHFDDDYSECEEGWDKEDMEGEDCPDWLPEKGYRVLL